MLQTAGDRGSHSGRASAVVQAELLGVHRAWMRRQGHVERGHRIYTSGLQPWWGCLKNGSKKALHTPTSTCSSFVIILSGNQQDHAIVYSDIWCGIILDGDISCITVASHICIASVSGPAAPTLLSFRRSSTTKGRQRPGLSGLGLGSAWARPGQIGQARATDS